MAATLNGKRITLRIADLVGKNNSIIDLGIIPTSGESCVIDDIYNLQSLLNLAVNNRTEGYSSDIYTGNFNTECSFLAFLNWELGKGKLITHVGECTFNIEEVDQGSYNATNIVIGGNGGSDIDFSDYYNKEEVDNKIENVVVGNVDLSSYVKKEIGKNLFDKADIVAGHINYSNGNITTNTSYYTSNFIKVKANTTYVISPSIRKFLAYDNTKTSITSSYVDALTSNYVFTATQDGYIRFSIPAANLDTTIMEEGTTPTGYESYSQVIENDLKLGKKQLEQIEALGVGNKLTGKSIYTFGDSIAYGSVNGGGYSKILVERNGMTNTNYAIGGATITSVSGSTNNIINQINNASDVIPDFVLFNAYTNDCLEYDNSNITLGELDYNKYSNFDNTNFTGALENVLLTLLTKYKGARIIYITPHTMDSRNRITQNTLHDRAVEVCKKWGIPVVDLYNECGLNTNISTYKTYTDEGGTHPNQLGYERFYVPLIESKMKDLL